MGDVLKLRAIGTRGVNVVDAPGQLDPTEVLSAEGAELSYSGGRAVLCSRPGLFPLFASPLGSVASPERIVSLHDFPVKATGDSTLYAAFESGAATAWGMTTDGTNWSLVTGSGPTGTIWSKLNAAIEPPSNIAKTVTINGRMYYVDYSMQVHEFDGVADRVVSAIPRGTQPGLSFAPPSAPVVAFSGPTFPTPPQSSGPPLIYYAVSGSYEAYPYNALDPLPMTYCWESVYSSGNSDASTPDVFQLPVAPNASTLFLYAYPPYTYLGGGTYKLTTAFVNSQGLYPDLINLWRVTGGGLTGARLGTRLVNSTTGLIDVSAGLGITDSGQAGAPGAPTGASPARATTYHYRLVARASGSNSNPSASGAITTGSAVLSTTNFIVVTPQGVPEPGTVAYDVYRITGSAVPGGLIGSIPIVAGQFSTGNGSGLLTAGAIFTDAGITGNGAAVPTGASGTPVQKPLAITDMIPLDGQLAISTMDTAAETPNQLGRILLLDPISGRWEEVRKYYSQGVLTGSTMAPARMAVYQTGLSYATFGADSLTGAYPIVPTAEYPNPLGGVWNGAGTAGVSVTGQTVASMVNHLGDLWVGGYVRSGAGNNAALIRIRENSGATAIINGIQTGDHGGWTALCSWGGELYAALAGPSGSPATRIYRYDGAAFNLEADLGSPYDVVTQFVPFQNSLYAVTQALIPHSTGSRVLKRVAVNSWANSVIADALQTGARFRAIGVVTT